MLYQVRVEVGLEVIVLDALVLTPQVCWRLQLVLLHSEPPQVILEHQRVVAVVQAHLVQLLVVHLLLRVDVTPVVRVHWVVLGLDKAAVVEVGGVRVVALSPHLELEVAVAGVACVSSVLDLVRHQAVVVEDLRVRIGSVVGLPLVQVLSIGLGLVHPRGLCLAVLVAVGREEAGIQRLSPSRGPSCLVREDVRFTGELARHGGCGGPDRVLVDLDRPHVLVCVVGDVEGEHHDLLPAELVLREQPLQGLSVVQLDEEPLKHLDVLAAKLAEEGHEDVELLVVDLLLDIQVCDGAVQVGLLGLHPCRREVVEEADVAKDVERGLELLEGRVEAGSDLPLYLRERWRLGGDPSALSLPGPAAPRLSLLGPAARVGTRGLALLEKLVLIPEAGPPPLVASPGLLQLSCGAAEPGLPHWRWSFRGRGSLGRVLVPLRLGEMAMHLAVLPLPLFPPLLPLEMVLLLHVLGALPEVPLPHLLVLEVLVVDLVVSGQVGDVIAVKIVVEDVRAALLVFVDVVVQIVLRRRHQVSDAHVVVHDLGVCYGDARVVGPCWPWPRPRLPGGHPSPLRCSPLGRLSLQLIGSVGLVLPTLLPHRRGVRGVPVPIRGLLLQSGGARAEASPTLRMGEEVLLPQAGEDELVDPPLGSRPLKLLLGELEGSLQKVPHDGLVGLAPHGVLVDERADDFLDVLPLQVVLGQVHDGLADLEDLVVQVVGDAVAEDHEELEEELPEHFVRVQGFPPDVSENELEEIEHVQRGRALLADVLHFLEMRVDDLDKVDLDLGLGRALLDDLLQGGPDLLEEPDFVSGVHGVLEPVDEGLNQLEDAALENVGRPDLNQPAVVVHQLGLEPAWPLVTLIQPVESPLPIENVRELQIAHEQLLLCFSALEKPRVVGGSASERVGVDVVLVDLLELVLDGVDELVLEVEVGDVVGDVVILHQVRGWGVHALVLGVVVVAEGVGGLEVAVGLGGVGHAGAEVVLGARDVHHLSVLLEVRLRLLREGLAVSVCGLGVAVEPKVLQLGLLGALVGLGWHHHEHLGLLPLLSQLPPPEFPHLFLLVGQPRLDEAQLADLELHDLVDELDVLVQELQLAVGQLVLAGDLRRGLLLLAAGLWGRPLLHYLRHLPEVRVYPSDDEPHLLRGQPVPENDPRLQRGPEVVARELDRVIDDEVRILQEAVLVQERGPLLLLAWVVGEHALADERLPAVAERVEPGATDEVHPESEGLSPAGPRGSCSEPNRAVLELYLLLGDDERRYHGLDEVVEELVVHDEIPLADVRDLVGELDQVDPEVGGELLVLDAPDRVVGAAEDPGLKDALKDVLGEEGGGGVDQRQN